MNMNANPEQERTHLNFTNAAKSHLSFLHDLGFKEVESLPTLVRYRKGDIEVDVYHGRQSYEIGFGITRKGVQFSLPDFIAATDPQVAKQYSTPMASTQEGVEKGLERIGELAKHYCAQALLENDPEFFARLESKRKLWTEKYWLEMNARQLRPQAHEAFKLGQYREAAELYKKIRPLLSDAELKKLSIAEKRSSGSSK